MSGAHQLIGAAVVLSHALAALLLWRDAGGAAAGLWAARAALAARTLLLAQLALGLALVSQGYAGSPAHQLGGLAALAASLAGRAGWPAPAPAARRRAARGCALAGACALAAYLLARA